ncbi:MAG: sodium:solute symporter family protein [Planctomycetota bacterium]
MNLALLGLSLYVLAQLAIGVWVSRRIRTEEDFFVAGRRVGPLLAGASIFATWFGAETCIGAAGQTYTEGVGSHTVEPFAYGVCLLLSGLLFAAPLWRRKIVTLADLFRTRYSPVVERVAAILLVPSSVLWAAAQIYAFAHVLDSTSMHIEHDEGLAIAAIVVIVYTVFGGLLADIYTDVVQAGTLVVGLVVVAFVCWGELASSGGVLAAVERSSELRAATVPPPSAWYAVLEGWSVPNFGSIVAQELISRTVAARSEGIARAAGIGGGLAYLVVGLLPVLLGLVGPVLAPGLDDGELLLPSLAREHLHGVLFVLFAGALVSAILSTADSTLLVASSLVARNLVDRPSFDERTRLRVARGGVVVFGLAAWGLSSFAESIYDLLEAASAFASSGIFVIVTFGLFTKRGGTASALAALVLGVLVWTIGTLAGWSMPYLASLAAALVGFLVFAGGRAPAVTASS